MTTTCDGCRHADWKRTANGRLHPDKQGKCRRLDESPLDLRLADGSSAERRTASPANSSTRDDQGA